MRDLYGEQIQGISMENKSKSLAIEDGLDKDVYGEQIQTSDHGGGPVEECLWRTDPKVWLSRESWRGISIENRSGGGLGEGSILRKK